MHLFLYSITIPHLSQIIRYILLHLILHHLLVCNKWDFQQTFMVLILHVSHLWRQALNKLNEIGHHVCQVSLKVLDGILELGKQRTLFIFVGLKCIQNIVAYYISDWYNYVVVLQTILGLVGWEMRPRNERTFNTIFQVNWYSVLTSSWSTNCISSPISMSHSSATFVLYSVILVSRTFWSVKLARSCQSWK